LVDNNQRYRFVHEQALKGFTDGNYYDKSRPTYPRAIFDLIHASVLGSVRNPSKTNQSLKVLEIAAGTGKFTEKLIKSIKNMESFIALEPSDGFREKLQEKLPNIKAINGSANNTGLDDDSQDIIFVAQAFHWFATASALEEIHRILKPGGFLVLVWNGYDRSIDWIRRIEDDVILPQYPCDTPRYQSGEWKKCFDPCVSSVSNTSNDNKILFEPLSFAHVANDGKAVITDSEHPVRDRVLSTSVILNLPDQEREQVRLQLDELLNHHPDTRNREKRDIFITYRTEMVWTRAI